MAKCIVAMNHAGARSLLNGEAVQADLMARAERIADRAGSMGSGEYVADVMPGRNRAHARASTTDARSIVSNAKHNSLIKSMDAGR